MSEININIIDNKRIGVDVQSGVNGQTVAANVNITDTGSLYTATTVEGALQEVATNKANKVQEAWITPTLLNGWESIPAHPVKYRLNQFGRLEVIGQAKNTLSNNPQMFILASGYRPNRILVYPAIYNSLFGKLYISSTGSFEVYDVVVNHIVYLDNVSISLSN